MANGDQNKPSRKLFMGPAERYSPAAANSLIDAAQAAGETTGYKLYLRVPANTDNFSTQDVKDFLQKFIDLVDAGQNITVEEYDGDFDSGAIGVHEVAELSETYADAFGGPGSMMVPLYLCHNR